MKMAAINQRYQRDPRADKNLPQISLMTRILKQVIEK